MLDGFYNIKINRFSIIENYKGEPLFLGELETEQGEKITFTRDAKTGKEIYDLISLLYEFDKKLDIRFINDKQFKEEINRVNDILTGKLYRVFYKNNCYLRVENKRDKTNEEETNEALKNIEEANKNIEKYFNSKHWKVPPTGAFLVLWGNPQAPR